MGQDHLIKKSIIIGGLIGLIDFALISVSTMIGLEFMRKINYPFLFIGENIFHLFTCPSEGCIIFAWLIELPVLIVIGCLAGYLVGTSVHFVKNRFKK